VGGYVALYDSSITSSVVLAGLEGVEGDEGVEGVVLGAQPLVNTSPTNKNNVKNNNDILFITIPYSPYCCNFSHISHLIFDKHHPFIFSNFLSGQS
jgi:hypothetical protein